MSAEPKKPIPPRILRRDIDYQHRPAVVVNEGDPEGRPIDHIRVYNTTLDRLWRDGAGSITRAQYDAGMKFARVFQRAGLGPRYGTLGMERLDGGRREMSDGAAEAFNKASDALRALTDTAASAAEYVIGCDESIGVWARRMRYNGFSMSDEKARGVVHVALEQLARHYGFT